MSHRQGPHTWQERKKYSKEYADAVKLGVVLALEPQSNNDKIGTQVETAETQPSNLILYTNMNKDKTTDSVNEGRYERIRAADIKRHGYTELAGRNDPKRAHVVKANTLKIARDRRLAGIVPGSANARPENRSDVLIHSARMSGEKRAAGKPSPRIPRKNRDRKIITNSFNHGLEEGKLRNIRIQQTHPHTDLARQANIRTTERRNRLAGIVPGSFKVPAERAHVLKLSDKISDWKYEGAFSGGTGVEKIRDRPKPKNRNRKIADSFNHGLEEAKRPTTRPIKSSKNIFGAAARGAVRGLTTPKPAGTSRTGHVLRQVMGNIARHFIDKL